jgi:hypothetical protein
VSISLKEYLEFVVLWLKKRTGVHLEEKLVFFPAMVRHCLCCQSGGSYSGETQGLCRVCCRELVCSMCAAEFAPSDATVGTYCASCWGKLESTWTTTFADMDPGSAEGAVRSLVTASHPGLSGCRHHA